VCINYENSNGEKCGRKIDKLEIYLVIDKTKLNEMEVEMKL
jgi:hypothetical protein